mmetsp:Transcript_115395/g.337428  ORF Transcript_115395/g.337428 Transcript_115395/m.337428 type:complete len:204 (-) Transcript_115395:140-751(-)
MLPMQLPLMSGSFAPRKSVAISAGQGWPWESRKPTAPAGLTYFSSTKPAPHCSGMKRKSAERRSVPSSVCCGARFQFQKVALLKLLLLFIPSTSGLVSADSCPEAEMPGMWPTRPQPQTGSSAARAAFSWTPSASPSTPTRAREGRPPAGRPPRASARRAAAPKDANVAALRHPHRTRQSLANPSASAWSEWSGERSASASMF